MFILSTWIMELVSYFREELVDEKTNAWLVSILCVVPRPGNDGATAWK